MADGTSYTIDTDARSSGVETSADAVNRLAAGLDAAAAVSTKFDSAIAQTETLLAAASTAAQEAADAVASGSSKYASLEAAAMRAAKAVDKASQAGKDTAALQVAADAAAAALSAQGVALDELKAKSAEAAAAQDALSGTLKTLQGAAKKAAGADGLKATTEQMDGFAKALTGMPGGAAIRKLKSITEGFGKAGVAGAVALGVVAILALSAAAVVAVFSLAKLAISLNKVAQAKIDKTLEKARASFAKLFAGVHVDKFTDALEEIVSLFDEGTAEADGLKAVIETILNPLFDAIPRVTPLIKEVFRGLVLGALLAAIAVLKARNTIVSLIPESVATAVSDFVSDIDGMKTALNAGVEVVRVMAAALGVLVVLATIIGALFVAAFVVTFVIAAAVAVVLLLIVAAIYGLYSAAKDAGKALAKWGSEALAAAGNFITGLVDGIKNGIGRVVSAIKGLGTSAVSALNDALGNHSPSKYAILAAANVTHTFADTIDKGGPEVRDSMSGLIEPPDMPEAGGGGRGGGRGGISLSNVSFVFEGVKDAEHGRTRFAETFTRLLEGDVSMLGAGEPEPAT